ncbi:universal stress protein [Kitasatospora sp. NPDC127067]|uniref:universal stress protein n=1 Tax=Kitasatospora sp. NPDC127067 TaxID=3347126 RepID=UPI00364CCE11
MVGVDGSEASRAAIGFAFEEAALAGADIQAVEVRRPADAARPDLVEESLVDLSESLAGWVGPPADARPPDHERAATHHAGDRHGQ